jgi:hypothetical protein
VVATVLFAPGAVGLEEEVEVPTTTDAEESMEDAEESMEDAVEDAVEEVLAVKPAQEVVEAAADADDVVVETNAAAAAVEENWLVPSMVRTLRYVDGDLKQPEHWTPRLLERVSEGSAEYKAVVAMFAASSPLEVHSIERVQNYERTCRRSPAAAAVVPAAPAL